MKHCPITYDVISEQEEYSQRGLRRLAPKLHHLQPLNLTAAEQRTQAVAQAGKMSIQGVQTKLSAKLNIKEEKFDIVGQQGRYILKPQSEYYPELPENEAITMSLAETVGIEIPVHGLVYSKDNSMTYFIKRFDRIGAHKKLAVEDFSQLLKLDRDSKYDSSMEKIISVISEYTTFPKIESVKLFKRTLFNFLVGNEDMHLKNFSLITSGQIVSLTPAYDLLNTTIAQEKTREEIALPLNGKKSNLKEKDFVDYFAIKRLQLNQTIVEEILDEFKRALPTWTLLISNSFLSKPMQEKYLKLLALRCQQFGWVVN
jgi:serine/threonine-protein kinase HipA